MMLPEGSLLALRSMGGGSALASGAARVAEAVAAPAGEAIARVAGDALARNLFDLRPALGRGQAAIEQAVEATRQVAPRWYQDAIKMEIPVRNYVDSNADGIGDFPGLTSRLDHVKEFADAIWVTPFNKSPMRDGGYDVADFMSVHPDFGTMQDFERFLAEAKQRDMRVIIDFPLNHTSVDHPWFQRARAAPPGSPERDFYVWSKDPNKYSGVPINFKEFESSNWAWDDKAGEYYWHRWYAHQPDLNYDNPAVIDEIKKTLDFWYGKGVDGIRLDAAPFLVEREGTLSQGLPETQAIIRDLRSYVERRFPGQDKVLLAEANESAEKMAEYFAADASGRSTGINMAFNFNLMPNVFLGAERQSSRPIVQALEGTRQLPKDAAYATFLRVHDELTIDRLSKTDQAFLMQRYGADPQAVVLGGFRRRLMPLMNGNADRHELMNSMLLSQPGTPILYYGDEIGMGDNIFLRDRDAVRTPMQWTGERGAGFSTADPSRFYLPLVDDAAYRPSVVNVEAQQADPASVLNRMRRLVAARRSSPALRHGSYENVPTSTERVIAHTRTAGDQRVLAVANLSDTAQTVTLDLSKLGGTAVPFQGRGLAQASEGAETLTLEPYGYQWFELR